MIKGKRERPDGVHAMGCEPMAAVRDAVADVELRVALGRRSLQAAAAVRAPVAQRRPTYPFPPVAIGIDVLAVHCYSR